MLRIGLVGLGKIAMVHAANIAANPRMKLAAAYDPFAPEREAVARANDARLAGSLQELVGADDVDAVVVASPTDTHCDVVMAAAAAGKPIYCEKPIDLDIERSQAAVDAIAGAGVPVMMGFNRRFEPAYTAIRDGIRDGELGRLQIVQMTSRGPQNPPTPDYVKSSGGFFRDKGVHFFDLLRFITDDEPVEISTMGAVITDPFIGEAGDYDTFVATLRMRSGALCLIDNTRRASYGYDERIEAFGAAGMIEAPRILASPNNRTTGLRLASSDFPQNLMQRIGPSYAIAMGAFASLVLDGAADVPTIYDGLAAQFIAEAALLSSAENRVVAIDEVRHRHSSGGTTRHDP